MKTEHGAEGLASVSKLVREDFNVRGHVAMFAACVLFGLMSPLAKAVLDGRVDALTLTMLRLAGAAVVFWIASLFVHRERVTWADLGRMFIASMLGVVLNQLTFIVGVSLTSPIDATVITTTTPIFVMLIAALYLREPITGKKVLGVLTGATGALLLILSGARAVAHTGSSVEGNLLCLASQLSFATYFVLFKKMISRYTPITLMKWMFLYATVCCLPFCWSSVQQVPWSAVGSGDWWRIGYVVLGGTFVGYLLMPIGQKNLRPTVASSYNYTQPMVASLVSVWMGLDHFGWVKVGAMVLVFTGVFIVTRSKSRAQIERERMEIAEKSRK